MREKKVGETSEYETKYNERKTEKQVSTYQHLHVQM